MRSSTFQKAVRGITVVEFHVFLYHCKDNIFYAIYTSVTGCNKYRIPFKLLTLCDLFLVHNATM